jgi:hypothetical protein
MWSLPRRLAFRYFTVLSLLLIYPFPLQLVPIAGVQRVTMAPVDWCVKAFAEHVLGIAPPPLVFTGSGDTLWHFVELLMYACIAAVVTVVWSIVRRRCQSHARQQAAMIVLLRYYVACMMFIYGVSKVWIGQFPPLTLARADQTIGEMSPMGMLWTFMGSSPTYTFVTGFVEVLGGVLLLWRRTQVIGAIVVVIAMTQVVLLNFTYDVPVKLFSLQLLAMAIAIALPAARRMMAVALGYAAPEAPPRVRGSLRYERVRFAIKTFVLVAIALNMIGYAMFLRSFDHAPPPLSGSWAVETFEYDGAERAPLITDDARWRKIIVTEYGIWIRLMTDRRGILRGAQIDPDTHTIIVPDGVEKLTWHYEQPDAQHLVLRGELRGHTFVAACRLEPPPELLTRGFHWIQEAPYHR